MVGLGETNFPLFALALAKGEAIAGLVATVPQLIGALLQLCAPWGIQRLGSPRRWIILCASIQGASFVPMVIAAMVGVMPTWWLFAVASLYWAVNLGAAPAWNTWVGALFPRRIRVRYFGWRSRIYQFSILAALLLGGLVLALGNPGQAERLLGFSPGADFGWKAAFAAVFLLAGASRLWSVRVRLPACPITGCPLSIPPATVWELKCSGAFLWTLSHLLTRTSMTSCGSVNSLNLWEWNTRNWLRCPMDASVS